MSARLKENLKQEHLNVVSTALQSLRMIDDGYTDAVIECKGITFPVHRAVLHAGSAYFAAKFQTNMKEAVTCKVVLEAVDAQILKIVLDFVYTGSTGNMDEDEKTLQAVAGTAHMLRVDLLYDYCWTKLKNNLNPNHFLDIWNLAELYTHQEVLQKIPVLIAENFSKTVKSKDFPLLSPSQIRSILACEKLSSSTEVIITETINWVRHSEAERADHLPELMNKFDLQDVSNSFLAQLTTDSLIKNCAPLFEKCVTLLLSRLQSNHLVSGPKIVGFTTSSKIITYSLSEGKWDKEKDLPFTVVEGMATKEWEGCIYFFSGEYENDSISSCVYHYMPATNNVQAIGKLQIPVKNVVIGVSEGSRLVFGTGKKKTNNITVQRYNPVTRRSILVGNLDIICDLYFVFNLADKLYLCSDNDSSIEIFVYNPSTNFLEKITSTSPSRHSYSFITVYNHQLCVLKDSKVKHLHTYDPTTKKWSTKPFKRPNNSDFQLLAVSNKDKELPFLVLWEADTVYFYLYTVDMNTCDEVTRPSIAEDTFCNCVVVNP